MKIHALKVTGEPYPRAYLMGATGAAREVPVLVDITDAEMAPAALAGLFRAMADELDPPLRHVTAAFDG